MRGIIITRTLHVPGDVPRTALPANLHRVAPDVMLIRIVPCELRGMERPAAAAMRAADSVRNLRTVNSRLATVVDPATESEAEESDVVVVDTTMVVIVVAAAATVVGATVELVGAVVVLEEDDELDELLVVVVDTVSEETVTAADRSTRSFTPS